MFDLHRYFPNGITCIADVGANVGSVSIDFAYYFPEAKVIAYEPINATFQQLLSNIRSSKNIAAYQNAVGAHTFSTEIALNKEHTINSLASAPDQDNGAGLETIHVVSLDEHLPANGISTPQIIKIDVEGYEKEVIAGAARTIASGVWAIVVEVGYKRSGDKVHFSDMEVLMESKGFQCCGVYDLSRSRDKRTLYYSNNLYIHRSKI